ncbi:MAG TPA: MEDS domain-containing protein [Acidimicrobiales bacterium]|nr:MEDS domain-containing protein [Acidimicrobiales bacterium]
MGSPGMGNRTATGPPDTSPCRHIVEFYEREDYLIGTVAGFLGPALNDGDTAVIVATEAHRRALGAALRASSVDVNAAVAADRYLTFDAAQQLDFVMGGGAPDSQRLRAMVRDAAACASAAGRRVRVYGEMVTLLWNAGDDMSALALEDLWSGLAEEFGLMVLCAYPIRSFARDCSAPTGHFERICASHSTVIPSESYAMLGGEASRRSAVAHLGQAVATSEAQRARRATTIAAEVAHVDELLRRTPPTRRRREDPGARAVAAAAILLALEIRAGARTPAEPRP